NLSASNGQGLLRELPGGLHRPTRHLALALELQHVRVHLPTGGLDQLGRQVTVAVERRDQLRDLQRTALQQSDDLSLTRLSVRGVVLDERAGLVDDVAVARAQTREP